MKHYKMYMDRQGISPEVHERLLELEPSTGRSGPAWARYGALAACTALIVAVGAWRLASAPPPGPAPSQSSGPFTADHGPLLEETDAAPPDGCFLVSGPEMEDGQHTAFYAMPDIRYTDVSGIMEVTADMVLAREPGEFWRDLEKADIQRILWGPEGKPEGADCDLPWALSWTGYTVRGQAHYNGQGELQDLYVRGEKEKAGFTLTMSPGRIPPYGCIPTETDQTTQVFGVEVAGWYRQSEGADGTSYTCGSEFLTKDEVGVRFESWDNGRPEEGLDGEIWFNTLFVRQALVSDGGLYLDHLMVDEDIPAWREESFSALAQARQESEFAPYLPASGPDGFSEFEGRLSYQEGGWNGLFLLWRRPMGYDDVAISVSLPEDGDADLPVPVDIAVPASYDTRLYEIPWCDSVPEEYVLDFYSVTFRARDMSLETVRARQVGKDTGGSSFHFKVLHDDGTVVSYTFSGLTAEQVWAIVEETL
ncbi:hypothetical protein D7V91_12940 [bacterium 1xD42-67]|nr:hypothetical protein D7V91_12940 [bacterium 1xD42-67]